MCGRYQFKDKAVESVAVALRAIHDEAVRFSSRINHAPTMQGPVIRERQGSLHLDSLRWGLVVPWTKAPVINAQSEGVRSKPTFKRAIEHQRCLVITTGFYEWDTAVKPKQPWLFALPEEEPMVIAGLWTQGHDPDHGPIESYAVLTTAANDTVSRCHDRMPVILPPASWKAWLDPANESEHLQSLWKPWPGPMDARPVTPALNKVAYQDGPLDIEVRPSNTDHPVQEELF